MFYIGVDLGKKIDFTAIAIVELRSLIRPGPLRSSKLAHPVPIVCPIRTGFWRPGGSGAWRRPQGGAV